MFKEIGTLAEIGAKVGDVVEWGGSVLCPVRFKIGCISYDGEYYEENDNVFSLAKGDALWRIVSRAKPTGPVITETVTRKRIVPGVYGKVSVFKDEPNINHFIEVSDYMSRADLIAARDVFNQLIEALEE